MDHNRDAQIEKQIKAAQKLGEEKFKTDPRATEARYDRASGRVIVELVSGCTYIFPAHLLQDFQDVDPAEMDDIIVDGLGYNLHWPKLDVDVYVPALIAGIFGTKRWMAQALAQRAGQVKSPAKAAAARENGKKGGRPRKVAHGRSSSAGLYVSEVEEASNQ